MDAETVGGAVEIALVESQGSEDELPFEGSASLSESDTLADQMPDELIKPVAQVLRRVLGNAVVCAALLQGESRTEAVILAQIGGPRGVSDVGSPAQGAEIPGGAAARSLSRRLAAATAIR